MAVDPNSDASSTNIVADAHTFRIVLLLDKSPNGASESWDTVFDSLPNNDGQLYDYPNMWFYKSRFELLHDKLYTVEPSYVVYDGANYHAYGNNRTIEFAVNLNHSTWYSDTTSNLAAIQRGNLTMYIASDASSTTYTTMKFSYRSWLEYEDY